VILPAGLHTVKFGDWFNQKVELPAGLHTVEFGSYFNQEVELPAGLRKVEFGYRFNQKIIINKEFDISIIQKDKHHLIKYRLA
jgi:hypothetical protein